MSAAEMPAGATPERAPDWHSIEWKNVWRAWFKSRLQLRVAGVDARRATPPDPRPPRWGLAGYCQLDPSHPAIVTCEGSDFEPCQLFVVFRPCPCNPSLANRPRCGEGQKPLSWPLDVPSIYGVMRR